MANEASSLPEQFHALINIEKEPSFLGTAKQLSEKYLAAADYDASTLYQRFDYSHDAFDARLSALYAESTAASERKFWLDSGNVLGLEVGRFSDKAVVEFLRQMAPINLTDGAWLRHILGIGPCDRVRADLFSIWIDEAGNGKPELNHANIYDTLLKSQHVFLPPITSHEFLDQGLLASGFESPVFQISVSCFPEAFFPELLGMTLYLEWESTPTLEPLVRLLGGRGMDPHFYRLHVAIDNIVSGHGAIAKRAIKAYLDTIEEQGGSLAVQHAFQRIWNGYVAWATLGSFGHELAAHLMQFDSKTPRESRRAEASARMVALIAAKAPVARKSHGRSRVGGSLLNDLFDRPEALMQALLAERWIDLERPRDSRLFVELLSSRGPMYRVFTDDEQDTILDWIESLRPISAGDLRVRAAALPAIDKRELIGAGNVH